MDNLDMSQLGAPAAPAAVAQAAAEPLASAPLLPAAHPAGPAVVDLDAGQEFGRVEYVLKRPFKLHGLVREKLSMREPLGRDLRDAPRLDDLAAKLCGIEAEAMADMHATDYAALVDMLGNVLAGRPAST